MVGTIERERMCVYGLLIKDVGFWEAFFGTKLHPHDVYDLLSIFFCFCFSPFFYTDVSYGR